MARQSYGYIGDEQAWAQRVRQAATDSKAVSLVEITGWELERLAELALMALGHEAEAIAAKQQAIMADHTHYVDA